MTDGNRDPPIWGIWRVTERVQLARWVFWAVKNPPKRVVSGKNQPAEAGYVVHIKTRRGGLCGHIKTRRSGFLRAVNGAGPVTLLGGRGFWRRGSRRSRSRCIGCGGLNGCCGCSGGRLFAFGNAETNGQANSQHDYSEQNGQNYGLIVILMGRHGLILRKSDPIVIALHCMRLT